MLFAFDLASLFDPTNFRLEMWDGGSDEPVETNPLEMKPFKSAKLHQAITHKGYSRFAGGSEKFSEGIRTSRITLQPSWKATQPPTATGIVLLSEAMCAMLFGTFRGCANLRPRSLLHVNWLVGLNGSDPLATEGNQSMGTDAATFNRTRTVENAKKAGPILVHVYDCPPKPLAYTFSFFNEAFRIPAKTVEER